MCRFKLAAVVVIMPSVSRSCASMLSISFGVWTGATMSQDSAIVVLSALGAIAFDALLLVFHHQVGSSQFLFPKWTHP